MAIARLIARGIGFSPGSVKFIPTHGFVAGVAIPAPTVNYQSDGKGGALKRKRRNRTHELFEEMERTIREALAGPAFDIAPSAISKAAPSIDISRGFESALTQLATIAREHEDLSYRLAGLRRAVEEYEAKQLKALADDDEEIWLMM